MNKIILTVSYLLIAGLVCGADPGNNSRPKDVYPIADCLNTFNASKAENAASGWFYWFVREQITETGMNLKMSYVDKQTEVHPPHKHPEREFYYIVEGRAEVFLAGETRVINPNTALFCPPNVLHGIKRADGNPLKYLVIREGKAAAAAQVNGNLPEYTMDNCITSFSEEKADKARTGWYFWFATKKFTGGLNLKMTYVDKLISTHEPHSHPGEEILFLLEGHAEIHLNGQTQVIGPNTSIYYQDRSLHCIKRVDDKPIRYLVINP